MPSALTNPNVSRLTREALRHNGTERKRTYAICSSVQLFKGRDPVRHGPKGTKSGRKGPIVVSPRRSVPLT